MGPWFVSKFTFVIFKRISFFKELSKVARSRAKVKTPLAVVFHQKIDRENILDLWLMLTWVLEPMLLYEDSLVVANNVDHQRSSATHKSGTLHFNANYRIYLCLSTLIRRKFAKLGNLKK